MTSPILLWGATGFTGKLTAQHLAQAGLGRGQLILGGRNAQRLDALAAELGLDVELRVADAHDPSSLGDLLDHRCQDVVFRCSCQQYGRDWGAP